MSELETLQGWFFEVVTHPEGVTQALDRPDPTAARQLSLAATVHAGKISPQQRLEIYHHGYAARLIECLEDDYPVLCQALGQECFQALARDYVASHPPRSASLNYYGALFADYCASRSESWADFAHDLARLEWALVEAIHAGAEPVLEVATMTALEPGTWAQVRLLPSDALRVLECTYPVDDYLQAFREERELPIPEPQASVVAVCRRGEDLFRVSLTRARARLLEALLSGRTLDQALDVYLGSPEVATLAPATIESDIRAAFCDWVECGFFAELEVLT